MRTEQEVFEELDMLSTQDGFWEVIAFFCWKDTFIHFSGDVLDSQALAEQFDKTRLSRTELSTLIGLACKNGFNDKKITLDEFKNKVAHTWNLLDELHKSFSPPFDFEKLFEKYSAENAVPSFNEFTQGLSQDGDKNHFMREAIFYGGDGAFKHQYRDLSKIRYACDESWIEKNKGFSLSDAVGVITAIEQLQLEKMNGSPSLGHDSIPRSSLSLFKFSISEVVTHSGLTKETVESVILTFSSAPEEGMDCFKSVDDFNHRNAFPIIKVDKDTFISFQAYSLWESLYESPYFWFNEDKAYIATASKNRGDFTETFTAERLALVFGKENVFTNIDIFDGKDKAGEIDVLVTFGYYAIVIQAKSKKLTIEARKGNSNQLKSDFKKAIQDAYDQSLLCAELLQKKGVIFKGESGEEISISSDFKTILPVCIVSDHFPALSAQARHFLKYQTTNVIKHPYVMDVFLIDMITEMLSSPLQFIDYLIKRSDYGESILSNHELIILSIYIKQNLYFEENPTLVMLEDDISADLEMAMLVRRDNYEGERTPKGFLTSKQGTHVGKIIEDIEHSKDYGLLKLGLHLLSMSGDSIDTINYAISKMVDQFKIDYQHHDISLPLLEEKTGLTVHCNEDEKEVAFKKLVMHCEKRKYTCKADSWVGCCFSPIQGRLRFSTYHEGVWHQLDEMDELVEGLRPITSEHHVKNIKDFSFGRQQVKQARNEPCSCGSGKKYKRCCKP